MPASVRRIIHGFLLLVVVFWLVVFFYPQGVGTRLGPRARTRVALSGVAVQEVADGLHVPILFLDEHHVPALLEDHELGAGDPLGHGHGGVDGTGTVVAPGQD